MPKKVSQQDFIDRATKVHNGKYDYSLVCYKNNSTKVKIICPIHGLFEQRPASQLQGNGCPSCGREVVEKSRKLTTAIFIDKANIIHENRYDYSLVNYVNSHTKIKIICPLHGVFEQTPTNHLFLTNGCPTCGGSTVSTTNSFIEKASNIHNFNYDYSLVKYKNNNTRVDIICLIHGIFKQTPGAHLQGSGCPKCGIESTWKATRLSMLDFIERSNKVHNNIYDYSQVVYENIDTKVEILCKKHGSFSQSPYLHLTGSGCPKCNLSHGETLIVNFLQINKIYYDSQFRIKDCKDKRTLPFDFAIFEDQEKTKLKCLIEFDGQQHFQICARFKMTKQSLELNQLHDKIKTDYCLKNNIKLIRISFWEKDSIEEILKKELTFN